MNKTYIITLLILDKYSNLHLLTMILSLIFNHRYWNVLCDTVNHLGITPRRSGETYYHRGNKDIEYEERW